VTGVFCNQCGHQNPAGSNFCSSCGAALERSAADDEFNPTTLTFTPIESAGEVADDEISVPMEEIPEGFGVLIVKRGPNAGSRFVLEHEKTEAGRHPDSDIFLDDITVSRRHAEFLRQGGGYVVRDAGSLNGTYVNRERIDEGVLHNGDEVQIGKFRLVFLAGVSEA
jgi:pSer/pThr/pTyr-binding forkhead associated (FHA) protein